MSRSGTILATCRLNIFPSPPIPSVLPHAVFSYFTLYSPLLALSLVIYLELYLTIFQRPGAN